MNFLSAFDLFGDTASISNGTKVSNNDENPSNVNRNTTSDVIGPCHVQDANVVNVINTNGTVDEYNCTSKDNRNYMGTSDGAETLVVEGIKVNDT